ncbi:energy transducer TonB [Neisseria wadsworthii]|uniref:TonB C-terminal domain-containing protein n=1 Tax=Neisseria wadsworthii 9715 TaxID=1030841 RepID=G4CS38_9NEIS|nr:TonB family protein [Neisseria wadsworthii]EGZ44952.1 hypothetical protein HMPREF9370_1898 [Neisseria wadsworthii 9715]QMT35551.1 TonB family protein [Neisseria wadsworthii]
MSIRNILSTALVAAALFGAQSASAGEIQFFKKDSEVTAAKAQINGRLAVRMTIHTDGSLKDIRVTRSSGNQAIDNQAVAWMQTQTMRPVSINGEHQTFSVVKEIQFSNTGMRLGMK